MKLQCNLAAAHFIFDVKINICILFCRLLYDREIKKKLKKLHEDGFKIVFISNQVPYQLFYILQIFPRLVCLQISKSV